MYVNFCVEMDQRNIYIFHANSYTLTITNMAELRKFELGLYPAILTKSKCLLVEVMHNCSSRNYIILRI